VSDTNFMEDNKDATVAGVEGKLDKRENVMLLVLVFVAVLSFLVVLLLYRWKLGSALSTASGDWSDFGGYVGGVLGPIISFLTLVAILITIKVQRQFLKVQEREFSELYKLQRDTFNSQMQQARQLSADAEYSRLNDRKNSLLKNIERFDFRTVHDIQQLESVRSDSEASYKYCKTAVALSEAEAGVALVSQRIKELESRRLALDAFILEFTLTEHVSVEVLQKHFHDKIIEIYK
jgi:uncharacterized membrane protein